jgi:hypothetical protein
MSWRVYTSERFAGVMRPGDLVGACPVVDGAVFRFAREGRDERGFWFEHDYVSADRAAPVTTAELRARVGERRGLRREETR